VVADAGCTSFIVHARKAWLDGLSPKDNREVPPLDYERVWRLKARRPELTIAINGGIETLDEVKRQLCHVDGAMLGRAAYADPYLLAEVDREIFGSDAPTPSRLDVLDRFMPYVEAELAKGLRLNQMTRHILGLFHGVPRARLFRRYLAENAHLDGAGIEVLKEARRVVIGRSPPSRQLVSNSQTHSVMPGTRGTDIHPKPCPA
jgi:tRNA-dihydrouridine synthase A